MLADLGGRTADEALSGGHRPATDLAPLCEAFDVPTGAALRPTVGCAKKHPFRLLPGIFVRPSGIARVVYAGLEHLFG